jgi:triosephosphate isomerase (TIM)
MTRRPLVAGNWKMHKTPQETQEFVELVLSSYGVSPGCDVLLIPPFTSLDRAGRLLSASDVLLGAQDVHPEPAGAFTGAVSARMLVACGCAFVLVGHSERRHVFGDSDQDVNRKLHAALSHGLHPILCVGETLEQRRARQTESVLERQLDGGLAGIDRSSVADVVIAYEPVWAIGTGETATPEQAQSAASYIRSKMEGRFGQSAARAVRILYGGSVNPSNARSLQSRPDIDGALVGGASLDADSFQHIVAAAQDGAESC